MKSTADPIVPKRRATSALLFENAFTAKIPAREQISPSEANANGMNCRTSGHRLVGLYFLLTLRLQEQWRRSLIHNMTRKYPSPFQQHHRRCHPHCRRSQRDFVDRPLELVNFADEIRPDISTFCKNTAADAANSAPDEPPIASLIIDTCAVPP